MQLLLSKLPQKCGDMNAMMWLSHYPHRVNSIYGTTDYNLLLLTRSTSVRLSLSTDSDFIACSMSDDSGSASDVSVCIVSVVPSFVSLPADADVSIWPVFVFIVNSKE